MITLYGIPNCDTVKKAQKWLDSHNVSYQFHDFRKDGIDSATVSTWLETLGWDKVVNKRSTTWRGLSDETKTNMNAQLALTEILQQPTLIKRPVVDTGKAILIGFNEQQFQDLV